MANAALVDSDICIDVTHGVVTAADRLDQEEQNSTLSISAMSNMELLVGCANKTEQARTERFLRRFRILPIDAAVSDQAIALIRRYRLSHGLLIPDALIAATALVHDIPLLTKNQRDFRFIADIRLPPYP